LPKITRNQSSKIISASLVLTFITITPMTLGMRSVNQTDLNLPPDIIVAANTRSNPTILAEKDKTTTGKKAQTENDNKTKEIKPQNGSETDAKDPSAKSKAAPLKSFRPSEEIAAEQAVDFPVDI
jgi:hypothetical protein